MGPKEDWTRILYFVPIFCFSNFETLQAWWISFPKSGLPWSETYQNNTLEVSYKSMCHHYLTAYGCLGNNGSFQETNSDQSSNWNTCHLSHLNLDEMIISNKRPWSCPLYTPKKKQTTEGQTHIALNMLSLLVSRERLLAWPATPCVGGTKNDQELWFDEGNTYEIHVSSISTYIYICIYWGSHIHTSTSLNRKHYDLLVHESVEQMVSLIVSWHLWGGRSDGDNMKNVHIYT